MQSWPRLPSMSPMVQDRPLRPDTISSHFWVITTNITKETRTIVWRQSRPRWPLVKPACSPISLVRLYFANLPYTTENVANVVVLFASEVSSLPSNFQEHPRSSPPPPPSSMSMMVSSSCSPSLIPRSPIDSMASPLIVPAKPVPSRPLPVSHATPSGPQQLFSSHLQSLLYRHQYLSGNHPLTLYLALDCLPMRWKWMSWQEQQWQKVVRWFQICFF